MHCLYIHVLCIQIYNFVLGSDSSTLRDMVVMEAFLRMFVETCGHYTEYTCTQMDGQQVFEVSVECIYVVPLFKGMVSRLCNPNKNYEISN